MVSVLLCVSVGTKDVLVGIVQIVKVVAGVATEMVFSNWKLDGFHATPDTTGASPTYTSPVTVRLSTLVNNIGDVAPPSRLFSEIAIFARLIDVALVPLMIVLPLNEIKGC